MGVWRVSIGRRKRVGERVPHGDLCASVYRVPTVQLWWADGALGVAFASMDLSPHVVFCGERTAKMVRAHITT